TNTLEAKVLGANRTFKQSKIENVQVLIAITISIDLSAYASSQSLCNYIEVGD
ncbi:3235_t:CDS:2, partial [Gigaspora margarita]